MQTKQGKTEKKDSLENVSFREHSEDTRKSEVIGKEDGQENVITYIEY